MWPRGSPIIPVYLSILKSVRTLRFIGEQRGPSFSSVEI